RAGILAAAPPARSPVPPTGTRGRDADPDGPRPDTEAVQPNRNGRAAGGAQRRPAGRRAGGVSLAEGCPGLAPGGLTTGATSEGKKKRKKTLGRALEPIVNLPGTSPGHPAARGETENS